MKYIRKIAVTRTARKAVKTTKKVTISASQFSKKSQHRNGLGQVYNNDHIIYATTYCPFTGLHVYTGFVQVL